MLHKRRTAAIGKRAHTQETRRRKHCCINMQAYRCCYVGVVPRHYFGGQRYTHSSCCAVKAPRISPRWSSDNSFEGTDQSVHTGCYARTNVNQRSNRIGGQRFLGNRVFLCSVDSTYRGGTKCLSVMFDSATINSIFIGVQHKIHQRVLSKLREEA